MRFRILDVETTGLTADDEVIEAGSTDAVYVTTDDGPLYTVRESRGRLYGNLRPIDPATRAIHHIDPADLVGLDPFTIDRAQDFAVGPIHPDILVAHNCAFEQMFFPKVATEGLDWICTHKVAKRVLPEAKTHSNFGLFYTFLDQGKILPDMARCQPAHRAAPDTYVTAMNLGVLLNLATVEQMVEWTKQPALMTVLNFGKHKGMKLSEVGFDYLQWIAFKSDMDEDTKWNARREMDSRGHGGRR